MPKLILGFVGLLGSGKGAAAKILTEEYNAEIHVFSDILKDIIRRLGLVITRENLQALSTSLREEFGQDILAKAMALQAENAKADLVIIDGIRREGDMVYLEKIPHFHLIAIEAPEKTRFERVSKRTEKADETGMSWEEFQTLSLGEPELQIPIVAQKAEVTLDNSGDLENLKKQLQELLTKYDYES